MTAGELAQVMFAAAALVSAIATLAVALRVSGKVDKVHDLANGQSQALNTLTAKASFAEGVAAERLRSAERP